MRSALLVLLALAAIGAPAAFDPVTPGRVIQFPADAGAHPGHRVEWWYVTGHLESGDERLGFQVTFFRARHPDSDPNPSRFSPRQVLFAHAAISDPRHLRLFHDQRIARALAPIVDAGVGDTDVRIEGWSLRRDADAYRAKVDAEDFSLDLAFTPTQAPMLQGDRGFSRKGPILEAASYYYSEPQMRVAGRITRGAKTSEATGVALLDHEWASELLVTGAVGWDWAGVNLDDGGALMAFRIRDATGQSVWAGATLRSADGKARALAPEAIQFKPRRAWKSPRTGTEYPVVMEVSLEGRTWRLDPLMDDQELDARASTGTLYWEGAVRATGPAGEKGRGYLELTGYAQRLPF